MAIIKINRSQARVNIPETPRLSALAMDQNVMINYGNSIAQVGKVIENARAKTQKTQDMNDLREILKVAEMSIIKEADKYKNSSNVADVQSFYNNVHISKFKELLKPYNKEVNKKFTTELYKLTNNTGMKLFASALKNHGEVTQENIKKDIFALNIKEASNNPLERDKAQKTKSLIFNNPETLAIFGKSELNKIIQSSIIETKTMQYSNRIKNSPMDVLLLGEENIANDVANENLAAQIYLNAETSLISKVLKEDKIESLNQEFKTKEKLTNFTYVLNKLNDGDKDISVDDINDLYKKTAINSSQRDTLFELFTNPTKLSEQNVIDMIEGSMLIADSVEEIDELQKQILSNPEFVLSLGLTEFTKYNNLFEKYREDQPAWTEYKDNKKLLEADLGKVSSGKFNVVQMALGQTAAIKKDEKLRINAVGFYDKQVLNGMSPADAYLKTTARFLSGDTIPPINNFTNLSSIKLEKPTELEAKNTSLYIKNRTNELVELYKNGAIDINAFSTDVAAIDSIEQLIELRTSLKKDPYGFEEKK